MKHLVFGVILAISTVNIAMFTYLYVDPAPEWVTLVTTNTAVIAFITFFVGVVRVAMQVDKDINDAT